MRHKILGYLRERRDPDFQTLDEYFEKSGMHAWNRLRDLARRDPSSVDDQVIEWAAGRMAEAPSSFFALLLDVAAKKEDRRARLIEAFRKHLPSHPGPALAAAGYNLHEFNHLLDAEWLDAARTWFDQEPSGAWGIVESAAMYRPDYVSAGHVDWFETRRAAVPRGYFVTMLSLAAHRPEEAPALLARALRAFPEHPAQAVEAAAFVARDEAPLQTPDLVGAVLRHFESNREKAWEFFEGAARTRPEAFDDALLDRLTALAAGEPGLIFSVLRRLMDARPDGAAALLDRYAALLRRHPAQGIDQAGYAFQNEDIRLLRPALVRAICEGFAAAPYAAYEMLGECVEKRPELVGATEVEAAVRNIGHATNRAFGFFKELLRSRPEFTRECTLALFECLAQEPPHRAFVRAEEIDSIVAISEAAHIKTGLENALREPPRVGSRRARALMAIMFRQSLRARRQVLLEALRYASGLVLWREVPKWPGGEHSEKYSPVWDFLMFIIDHSGDDTISTAAAERFLEGAFQLHYLCRTGAEHDDFLNKLDTGYPPPRPFPAGTEFLAADAELAGLYALVHELGRRFGTEPRVAALEEFLGRAGAAARELGAIREEIARSEGTRREKLEERERTLARQLGWRRDPVYAAALADPGAEARLPGEARAFLRREKKDLSKRLRDVLRAEAIRIALAAVERSRMDLYQNRLRDVLERDVDIEAVEPRILPSFLWFQAIGSMPNNRRYLKRLIEDRLARRPHDWLRTEPPAAAWAERVREAQPGVRLDRWRAPFSREYQYRPKDALAEKKRRMRADLAQARALLEKAGAKGISGDSYPELAARLLELRTPPSADEATPETAKAPPAPPPDPALLEEISMNLERVRIAEETPDSDFEGKLVLSVETDPFEILFMGEYGFASCLSLRGSNAWSAVSNAVDVDKVIVWAKEPGGNVVGRRLLALIPPGVLTFRTYTNRHGLGLDRFFDEFIREYAEQCGTAVVHHGRAGPLLSDRWYDDGAI